MTQRTLTGTGRVLGGRYMLLSLIAKGGMGEVWKTRDRVTGKIVAAKVMRPELLGDELPLSRLRLEARNSMSIQHPNIANVQDFGEENGGGWIIMELVEGRPLTDYLRGGGRITPDELLPLLMQVAMALGAAASAGVVHRDIKPANILVRPDGVVKLTDFGISRSTNQVDLTAAGMVMGTAQYLPPEQAMGETATSLGDLYGLGVIGYEAAAGRRPFTGDSQVEIAFSHVNDPVPPLPADVPRPLADVIFHLLEKTPGKRPQSGSAVVRELATVAKALGLSVSPKPLTPPMDSRPVENEPVRETPVSSRVISEDQDTHAATNTPTQAASELHDVSLSRTESSPSSNMPAQNTPTPASSPARISWKDRHRVTDLSADTDGAADRSSTQQEREHSDMNGTDRDALKQRLRERAQSRGESEPFSRRRGAAAQRPQWRTTSTKVRVEDLDSAPAAPTKYNRSVVAPPRSRRAQIFRFILCALIATVILALAFLLINKMFGSLGSLAQEVPSTEEVATWQIPWDVV